MRGYDEGMIRSTICRCSTVLLAICFLNAAACFVGVMVLGGEATSGKEENGRYYVGHRGTYYEVSEPVYFYSGIHCASLVLTVPIGMASGCVLLFCPKDTPPRRSTK